MGFPYHDVKCLFYVSCSDETCYEDTKLNRKNSQARTDGLPGTGERRWDKNVNYPNPWSTSIKWWFECQKSMQNSKIIWKDNFGKVGDLIVQKYV